MERFKKARKSPARAVIWILVLAAMVIFGASDRDMLSSEDYVLLLPLGAFAATLLFAMDAVPPPQ